MQFPKQRIRFGKTHEGHVSQEGYLFLDLKGLDIEGVTTLVIPMSDIEAARTGGSREDDARQRARDLLGG